MEAPVIDFCPECEGYSFTARDGEIPHSKGCAEPESISLIPSSSVEPLVEALEALSRWATRGGTSLPDELSGRVMSALQAHRERTGD